MSTITDETTTTAALLAEIRETRAEWRRAAAALPDLLDLPGSLSERQKNFERERRVRLQQHVVALGGVAEQLATSAATLAKYLPARDRLRAARATIDKQIADAPDYHTIVDRSEQTREWARQNALDASLRAIERGVEYFGGLPALPPPLRELLTDACASCGHVTLAWSAPLPDLEEKVAEAEGQIALAPGSVASLRESVQQWLAEPVTS